MRMWAGWSGPQKSAGAGVGAMDGLSRGRCTLAMLCESVQNCGNLWAVNAEWLSVSAGRVAGCCCCSVARTRLSVLMTPPPTLLLALSLPLIICPHITTTHMPSHQASEHNSTIPKRFADKSRASVRLAGVGEVCSRLHRGNGGSGGSRKGHAGV